MEVAAVKLQQACCLLIIWTLFTTPVAAQRFTPNALCATTDDSNYESLDLPLPIGGDYPAGSIQPIVITVGDTETPFPPQAATGDQENVLLLVDTDNNGIPELLSSASCAFNAGIVPPGCTTTQNLTIPTVTEDTTFRGRVMLSFNNQDPPNGCGNNGFGDFEDYLIVADVQETITISDVTAAEDGGLITVTATLSHNVRDASGFVSFTVDYLTGDGTATTANNDYTAASGTLTFNGQAGDTDTFTIMPTADIVPEGDEVLFVALLNLSNTTHGIDISDTAMITLQEDDTEVELELVKQVSDDSPNVGDTVIFTLQVNNNGPDTAVDAVVNDVLPAGFNSIVPVTVPPGSVFNVSGNVVNWSGVDVPSGGTAVVAFSAVVASP